VGTDGKRPKRSVVIARAIEDEIAEQKWPVGKVIASESELLDRFNVSRSVLREAIRLVEHTGAAHMRRGPGGGLTVTQPRREVVATAAGVYFASMGVSVHELQDAWQPLVRSAVELASANATSEDIHQVVYVMDEMAAHRRLGAEDFIDLQQQVTELSGNSVLSLFTRALGEVGLSRLQGTRAKLEPPLTIDDALRHLRGYRRLVDAISAHDGEEAVSRLKALQTALRERFQDRPARPRQRAVVPDARSKLAENIARLIRDDIERSGWQEGTLLGSEAELMERYGVSRAVLREAARILEFHGALSSRRGPGGGFFVSQPDSSAIVHAARVVIDFEGTDVGQIWDAREIIEDVCVRLATSRMTEEMSTELEKTLAIEAESRDWAVAQHVVHHELARATQNRPLVLFVDALAELSTARVRGAMRAKASEMLDTSDAHRAHQLIVEAVLEGDQDRAATRMRRHIRAAAKSY
jgi:DNA-binding FadR family transcriptional regulator